MSGTPKIQARNLLVRYGDVIALDSFTADIPEGVVGILGPNGAGKTTFIKVLLGLTESQRGTYVINTEVPQSEIHDIIGFMPENECLKGRMNAFEMVSYMGSLSGMSTNHAIQRAHEVLDFVDVGEERYREISSYSTGMKQRVKLAQAIVHDPEILMLDEPTNGMDPDGREEMLDLIEKIGMFGKTILVSSHLLHEVEQVCGYAAIINEGKLLRQGNIKELLQSEDGRYRIKIRGSKDSIDGFVRALKRDHHVESRIDESEQATLVVNGVNDSNELLGLVKSSGVQIRYYRPDILSLEDVFIETFEGGEYIGD